MSRFHVKSAPDSGPQAPRSRPPASQSRAWLLAAAFATVTMAACAGQPGPESALPDPTLAAASAKASAALEQAPLPDSARMKFALMVSLPTSAEPMLPSPDSAHALLLQERRAAVLKEWPSWFDVAWVSRETLARDLCPLAQRVAGHDSFGAPVSGPWGVGHVRVTAGDYFIAILPPASTPLGVPKERLRPYTPEEISRLDALDKERYLATRAEIFFRSPIRPPLDSEESTDVWLPGPRPRVDPEEWIAIAELPFPGSLETTVLSTAQRALVTQGLALAYVMLKDKSLTRMHWRIYDVGFGIAAQTVLTFRPPPTPDYLQRFGWGYLVRFVHDGRAVYFSVNRQPGTGRAGYLLAISPHWLTSPNWLSADAAAPRPIGPDAGGQRATPAKRPD